MSVSPDSGKAIDQITRTTQIIIGALIAGVTTFLVIVVCLVHVVGFGAAAAPGGQAGGANPPGAAAPANNPAGGQQPASSIPILTYLAAGVGAILLPLSFILPNIIATQSLRSGIASESELRLMTVTGIGGGSTPPKTVPPGPGVPTGPAAAFQTSAIIGGALDEGAAFLAGVAYLIEQNPIALVVALVLLAALVARFPTRDRVERWIALQEEKLRSGSFR